MKIISDLSDPLLASTLLSGGVAVIRTDTLYGIVARADDASAVSKVFAAKGRNQAKTAIVLVANVESAYDSHSELEHDHRLYDETPTSFVVTTQRAPSWLRRDNGTIAYRIPHHRQLGELLAQTGPLIAPSANPEGLPPALTVAQAINYFGDVVDIYVDGGEVPADVQPSRVLHVHEDGTIEQLR